MNTPMLPDAIETIQSIHALKRRSRYCRYFFFRWLTLSVVIFLIVLLVYLIVHSVVELDKERDLFFAIVYIGAGLYLTCYIGWILLKTPFSALTHDEIVTVNIITREIENYRDLHHRGRQLLKYGFYAEAIDDLSVSLEQYEEILTTEWNSGEWQTYQQHYQKILLDCYYRYRLHRQDCFAKLGRSEESRADNEKLCRIKRMIEQDQFDDALSLIIQIEE